MGAGVVGYLLTAESPGRHLSLAGLQMMAAAPPINKTSPSLSEVKGCEEVEGRQGG